MIPVIALVGRPNVGKSTLFNRITRTQDALVADFPGLTRDRQYGDAVFEKKPFFMKWFSNYFSILFFLWDFIHVRPSHSSSRF